MNRLTQSKCFLQINVIAEACKTGYRLTVSEKCSTEVHMYSDLRRRPDLPRYFVDIIATVTEKSESVSASLYVFTQVTTTARRSMMISEPRDVTIT